LAFLLALAISPVKDYWREWRQSKRDYLKFAGSRPDTKNLLASFHSGMDQIWIPELNVVDRCTTCHQGIAQTSLLDQSVPQPYRAHPAIPHRVKDWGCVVCHRGQGAATEAREAHETTLAWEQPLLPIKYIQASCGACHREDLPQTPLLNRGRRLLSDLNCASCHNINGIDKSFVAAPELTNIGNKTSREWIYKWLKEPRSITNANGDLIVNGYQSGDAAGRMPQFKLTDPELRSLSAYLSSLKSQQVEQYKFEEKIVADWQKKPDLIQQGEARFRQMFCTTCHAVSVTRAGETKLIGGNIGPELTKVASKVNPDWLIAWLRDPQLQQQHAAMPRYQWSDEDLYLVTQYISDKLRDDDLLANLPTLGAASDVEINNGKRLFLEKGCASCHEVAGISKQKDFGPSLIGFGGKSASQLEFGEAKISRNLISYIQSKLSNPLSVNAGARMPQYNLSAADMDAITTALMSMTNLNGSGYDRLIVPRKMNDFHPPGSFGEVYERYKCYACHQFNGFGSALAPDLTFEGSRARRQWIIDFMKNPQTVRPTLIYRMPQFNMTDAEAATIADYLTMVFQTQSIDQRKANAKVYTPDQAALGKQLYEVKYQCQSCHTIGSSGGYVGPNLSNVGNWLTPGWIEGWLKDPQSLVADAIEPRRAFSDAEVEALTAYLLTLKQTDEKNSSANALTSHSKTGGAK
jgi:mono/diheme cytochrome c family protein